MIRTVASKIASSSAVSRVAVRTAARSMSTLNGVSANNHNNSNSTTTTTVHQLVAEKQQDQQQKRNMAVAAMEPQDDAAFDSVVKSKFPGAMSNVDFQAKVISMLEAKGLTPQNTLLCTSLCADEINRVLEDDFVKVYGHNFNLGGLSGFPFAGNTGFGAMSAHIPDGGFCFVLYGPHVGITKDGTVGKIERVGLGHLDNCCGSAIAASNYLAGITDGGAQITTALQSFSDFQQGAVQEMILPHGKRLSDAEDRMLELPYALYDSQDALVGDIVKGGAGGTKGGIALIGGIQINTGSETHDYFHPLRFDIMNTEGEVVENMLPELTK